MTTLGIGGPARYLVEGSATAAREVVRQAWDLGSGRVMVLGSGSNLLVSDAGFDGAVLRWTGETPTAADRGCDVGRLTVGAGAQWDDVVRDAVRRGWQGIECLSGIPGLAGAAPIQNIGAYGQEVSDVVESVATVHPATGQLERFAQDECGFGYRTSRFKGELGDRVVVGLTLRLRPGAPATVSYRDVAVALDGAPSPSLQRVREAVLVIRRSKSMIIEAGDPNRRSAGSFFVNPVVPVEVADALAETHPTLPRYPVERGVKLPAAWLIEQSGTKRGERLGPVGISTRHTLALVNVDGDARAEDLLRLAALVRRRVSTAFGVSLDPEPVFVGFDASPREVLDAA